VAEIAKGAIGAQYRMYTDEAHMTVIEGAARRWARQSR
jgi:hypothetical protein